jgi:hypothetical protein
MPKTLPIPILFSVTAPELSGTGLTKAVDAYVGAFVDNFARLLVHHGTQLCKYKGTTITASTVAGTNYATVTVQQLGGTEPLENLETWAFDSRTRVPMGGFRPPPGQKFFAMVKPEGRLVYRTRTYTRHQGKYIKIVGYMSEAMRRTFTPAMMDAFGSGLADLTGKVVATKIGNLAKAAGFDVVIS